MAEIKHTQNFRYDVKIKVCGDRLQVTEMPHKFVLGAENKTVTRSRNKEKKEVNKIDIQITRQKIFDYVYLNCGQYGEKPKFLTLTFADEIDDIEIASKEFTKFNKRLSYHLWKEKRNLLKYVAVWEIQKKREQKTGKSVIHFHIIYFNLPYVPQEEIEKIWGNGFIGITQIKGKNVKESPLDMAKYITKYLSKDTVDYYKYAKKRFYCSRGLIKPRIVKTTKDNGLYQALRNDAEMTYFNVLEHTYELDGKVIREHYNYMDYKLSIDRGIIKELERTTKDIKHEKGLSDEVINEYYLNSYKNNKL